MSLMCLPQRKYHGKLAVISVVLMLLIVSSVQVQAQCTLGTCQTETVDGEERSGYWMEYRAGYYRDTSRWDYSNGRYEEEYVDTYDDQGNYVGFVVNLIFVPEPVWVESEEWVPPEMCWIDCSHYVQNKPEAQLTDHRIEMDISINEPGWFAGQKVYALLEWTVDKDGNVEETKRETRIGPTSILWLFDVDGGGQVWITGNPGSESANVAISGYAYSKPNVLLSFGSDVTIDFNFTVVMNYADGNPSGYVVGSHDIYPSYAVNVDDTQVYYHSQEPYGYFDASGIDTVMYGSVPVYKEF